MKFNKKIKKKSIINHERAEAFEISNELKLYTAVVTATLSNKFYETETETLNSIKELIKISDPIFVAKLAIYTREKIYLRSIPIVLVVELAKIHNGDSLVKNTVVRIIKRADEIVELLSYYQISNQKSGIKKLNKLSKQLQKGIALAFNNFDEYQFAKYNRKTEVTLKDALFLVHPKAKDEKQQKLFDKIVNNSLEIPYTWEVELSEIGKQSYQTEDDKTLAKAKKWEELIDSGRLGYMALMRNLRNILKSNVKSSYIKKIAKRLSDPKEIERAKQFPFRYLSAFREIEKVESSYSSYILTALEKAVKISGKNIKGFDLDTKILIASDVSGSMFSKISINSTISYYDIGLLLSMILQNYSKNVITGIFGDRWERITLPKNNILQNTMKLRKMEGKVGYSTNGYLVIDDLIDKKILLDKLFFFTDLQMWNSKNSSNSFYKSWNRYKEIAPNAKLYLFDLAGYRQAPLTIKDDVFLIAGWSDKIFDILDMIKNGKNSIDAILDIKI